MLASKFRHKRCYAMLAFVKQFNNRENNLVKNLLKIFYNFVMKFNCQLRSLLQLSTKRICVPLEAISATE